MTQFNISSRISLKSDPNIRGSIITILEPSGGHQVYEVMFDNQETAFLTEDEIRLEVVAKTPWDSMAMNALRNYRDFSIATTMHKVMNTANNTISSLKASRTIFKSYQYKPLVKFLASDRKRILVADEVGLGKTIEAGHILLELAGRKLLNNCLVICTKTLQPKWQMELREKFGMEFKICATSKELINDVMYDVNSRKKTLFAIINYEKTINPKLLETIQNNNYGFDLLICDEAHKLRNSETLRHKGMKSIMDFSEYVLFLTATPMMTSVENLYHLLNLLDPESYSEYAIFQNYISLNKPFIKALHRLNNREPLKATCEELENTKVRQSITIADEVAFETEKKVKDIFDQDPLYKRTIELLNSAKDSNEIRAKIQYFLSELNSLNHILTRSRKVEVRTSSDIIIRRPQVISTKLSEEEQEFFNTIFEESADGKEAIQLITKKRQVASCIPGFFSSESQLLQGIYDKNLVDSKFNAFKRTIVDEVIYERNQKVIVFAFYRKTLMYLQAKLKELNIKTSLIYGDTIDREGEIEEFKNDPEIKVLLSSEVGSEGVDLQFCNTVVNYDLPWNPMIVEQRIGRIDRVGQESQHIHIYTFIVQDSIEEKIYKRILERIGVFKESIGDLEEILSENETLFDEIEKLHLKLYTTNLTESEQIRIIDQVAQAIETDRLTLQKVGEELSDAIVYDSHFQNEINEIIHHNKYLTEIELKNFIDSIFRWEMTSCKLLKENEMVYIIKVPLNNKSILFNFIEKYLDFKITDKDLETLYHKFKTQHWGESTIRITFNQDFAYRNKNTEFINSYHPLIFAATKYFEYKKIEINQAYRIGLKYQIIKSQIETDQLAKENIVPGNHYILVVYNIRIDKSIGIEIKSKSFDFINSIVVDINGDDFRLLPENTSNQILGLCQLNSSEGNTAVPFNENFTNGVKKAVIPAILNKQEQMREEESIKLQSSGARRIKQEIQFFTSQLERKKKLLDASKGIETIIKAQIQQLEDLILRKNEELRTLKVNASHRIISVNHLEII